MDNFKEISLEDINLIPIDRNKEYTKEELDRLKLLILTEKQKVECIFSSLVAQYKKTGVRTDAEVFNTVQQLRNRLKIDLFWIQLQRKGLKGSNQDEEEVLASRFMEVAKEYLPDSLFREIVREAKRIA